MTRFVRIKNPGTDIFNLDVSNIENDTDVDVDDGDGNFTATTYWLPQLPAPDTEFHFQLYTLSGQIQSVGPSITNVSIAPPPTLAGPAATCVLTNVDGAGALDVVSETVPIDPNPVSGHIILRLAFDDATNHMTCSVSLNDGATFQTLPPVPAFVGVTEGEFLIGAGSTGGGGSPTTPQLIGTKAFAAKISSAGSSRRITYQVKDPHGSNIAPVGDPPSAGRR